MIIHIFVLENLKIQMVPRQPSILMIDLGVPSVPWPQDDDKQPKTHPGWAPEPSLMPSRSSNTLSHPRFEIFQSEFYWFSRPWVVRWPKKINLWGESVCWLQFSMDLANSVWAWRNHILKTRDKISSILVPKSVWRWYWEISLIDHCRRFLGYPRGQLGSVGSHRNHLEALTSSDNLQSTWFRKKPIPCWTPYQ